MSDIERGNRPDLLCPDCGHHLHRPKPGKCQWYDCVCGAEAASPAALERAVIDAAIRVHDSQQASGSTLAPGERGIGGQMMTAWIRAEPFEELLDATYALLRERDRARLAHPEEEQSGE